MDKKTVEQQAKEFLERERRHYEKRMKQAEINAAKAIEAAKGDK